MRAVRYSGTLWVVTLLLLLVPPLARAESWILQPELRLSQNYNDNFRLATDEGLSGTDQVWTTDLSTILGVTRATETTSVRGRVRLDFIKYSGDTDRLEDLNNQYAFLDVDHRWERLSASVAGAYARSNTLVNQSRDPVASDFGLGPVDPDAGLTTDQARSDEWRIAPRLNYELTERDSLSAKFRYTNKRYDDTDFTRLTDFESWQADVGATRNLTETSRLKLTAGILDYEALNQDRTYDTNFVTLEYAQSFTERLSGRLTVGWRKTDFDLGPLFGPGGGLLERSGSNSGGVYELEGVYTTELDRFFGPDRSHDRAQRRWVSFPAR